jgi:zinc transport system permease protein
MGEFLALGFAQRALAAGLVVGALCALLSVHVVLRRLAFMGVGISHAAFGGVALGLLLGVEPLAAGVVFSLATALGVGALHRRLRLGEDTAIGILFSTAMALGVIFLGLSRRYSADVFAYLFGSILAVSPGDLALVAALGLPVAAFLVLARKELFLMSFDEDLARVAGVPVAALHYGLLAALALVIVLAIKVVGIVLVSALVVIPAAAAIQLTYDPGRLQALALLHATLSVAAGIAAAWAFDLAPGATIVAVAALLFAAAAAAGRKGLAPRGPGA